MAQGFNSSGDIAAFVNTIWEGAAIVARDNSFMTSLVRPFYDQTGTATRTRSDYGTVAFQQIGDTEDTQSQLFTPTAGQSLTPNLFAAQFYLSDRRIRSDAFNVAQDAMRELGSGAASHVQLALTSKFSSLTGGTVGAAGGTATWGQLFAAVAKLKQQLAPEPYVGVLQIGQWYHLGTAVVPAGAVAGGNAQDLSNAVVNRWFVGRFYNTDWYVTADVATGTAAVGAVFSRDALAYDERDGFNIRSQRDESRGGGGYELNASMDYAVGVWRPNYGVQVVATSVVP